MINRLFVLQTSYKNLSGANINYFCKEEIDPVAACSNTITTKENSSVIKNISQLLKKKKKKEKKKISIFSMLYLRVMYISKWLECSLMAWETWVQSQVESYQRLKKWYLIHSCLTLSIIRYGSRVKWSNPGKGVAPSPTPWCSSYRKGSLQVTLNYGCQLYFLLTYLHRIQSNKLLNK